MKEMPIKAEESKYEKAKKDLEKAAEGGDVEAQKILEQEGQREKGHIERNFSDYIHDSSDIGCTLYVSKNREEKVSHGLGGWTIGGKEFKAMSDAEKHLEKIDADLLDWGGLKKVLKIFADYGADIRIGVDEFELDKAINKLEEAEDWWIHCKKENVQEITRIFSSLDLPVTVVPPDKDHERYTIYPRTELWDVLKKRIEAEKD